MEELSAMGPNEHLEELRVEAFLAPLGELGPASRPNGQRRRRARAVRLAVIVAVVVGLGAGIAVAEEQQQSLVTIMDTNGNVTTEPLVPVSPPGECANPACSNVRNHHAQKAPRQAPRRTHPEG